MYGLYARQDYTCPAGPHAGQYCGAPLPHKAPQCLGRPLHCSANDNRTTTPGWLGSVTEQKDGSPQASRLGRVYCLRRCQMSSFGCAVVVTEE